MCIRQQASRSNFPDARIAPNKFALARLAHKALVKREGGKVRLADFGRVSGSLRGRHALESMSKYICEIGNSLQPRLLVCMS